MTTLLPAVPVLVLMAAAVAALLVPPGRARRVASTVGVTAFAASAVALVVFVWRDGTQVLTVGGWPASFGIVLVVDPLSAAMIAVTAAVAVPVMLYADAWLPDRFEQTGFRPLALLMLAGVSLSFVTGDLFNLYVAFEVLLVASFGLMVVGGGRAELRTATGYVMMNLVASAFFLAGVAVLYGLTGTLNLAELAVRLGDQPAQRLPVAAAMLLLVAFGIKAAVFPLFFWLPAAYPTPPIPVAALFAGLLTKVGVYALIRTFTLLFIGLDGWIQPLLLGVAGLTMITGVLGAAAQTDIRRILSFHIVSQIGYMVMGLALMTPLALMGAVFYVVHHIVVKTNLFLVGGLVSRSAGHFELGRIGGLYRSRPMLALLFLVPALSLAGVPPLSGFWAKLVLIRAGLDVGAYWIVAVAAVVGVITLFSMTKIWAAAFWAPAPAGSPTVAAGPGSAAAFSAGGPAGGPAGGSAAGLWGPVAALAAATLLLGLWSEPVLVFAARAAEVLLDPSLYVGAVLGGAS